MNDIINASLEIGCGFFCWVNVIQLIKDKDVKGISWSAMVFFTMVAMWNIYYYPSLDQMLSFYGGLTVLVANFVWVVLAVKYRKAQRNMK